MFFNQGNESRSFLKDIDLVKAAAKDLQPYLLSQTLYWNVSIPGEQITLTPGQLLLAIRRLENSHLADVYQAELSQCLEVRSRWQSAWRGKAEKEWEERLRRFETALKEWDVSARYDAAFTRLLRERALLELLKQGLKEGLKPEALERLETLDALIKLMVAKGKFIWEDEIKDGFPDSTFWFLYCVLLTREKK
jgi:hypothetical protein